MTESPLMLSVSGLRGLVGRSLTPPVAMRYAAAFGQWLKGQQPGEGSVSHVVMGRDSRPSGSMIEMAVASGLLSVGCRVTSLGIVTTPGVAIMVEHLTGDGGMVITASHNPIVWNGIKALRRDGVAPPPDQARLIIERFKSDQVGYVPVDRLSSLTHNDQTHQVHVDRVLSQVDVRAIRRSNLKVVLDSVHGAGGPATARLLEELGVRVVHLYAEPTGRFPHEPEPTADHLTELCGVVRANDAAIGFAQDPDADRLAVVDERGRYIGEEYTLALACLHVLTRGQTPSGGGGGGGAVIVTNLSTSRMMDDVAARTGARLVRTPVGEANVVAAMRQHGALIGGEGNGGVIHPPVVHVRDSLIGIALLLELLAKTGKSVGEVVDQLPRYVIVKEKIDLPADSRGADLSAIQAQFASQKVDIQDGLRIDWPDRWVHIRPSNTEPILRVIAEASDEPTARRLIQDARNALAMG